MSVTADDAASALLGAWEHLTGAMPGAWCISAKGAVCASSGVDLPTLNGVWVASTDPASVPVEELLDRVEATGLSYCLQVRPAAVGALGDLALSRGMVLEGTIPLMVLGSPEQLRAPAEVHGLRVRRIDPSEAELHARVAASGFDAPVDRFLELVTPSTLSAQGASCYIGDLGGEPVTTALGLTRRSSVGVFNVATPEPHRRRGYGAAVTTRAVTDGFASGAHWAWLQSSDAGYRVYERLGFEALEEWTCWVAA
jgi:hypothetical protein